ncbi:MAG: cyclic nucleotide-binding domain-containing protein [Candidatus Nitrohelix vancouverensis]|uniref:Cyclic nucleotide-binding domain-containing protein n=1 Tax=Candidatus Nitrohelix vancouverensis TaxID=2705534 RepID=A0A7T0C1W6_9BACT|nr:MAG: cyclic nucleotide-binding domain-containing protein [Candidatus Nitrohelix vancouverensis]
MTSKKIAVKKGAVIFNQGNYADCAYIIHSGRVEILEQVSEDCKVSLGVLEENDIFGEMGLIDSMPRAATAVAIEDSEIFMISRESFDELKTINPEALIPIIKILSNRLRETLALLKSGYKLPGNDRRKVEVQLN